MQHVPRATEDYGGQAATSKWLSRPRDLGRLLRKRQRQPARTLIVFGLVAQGESKRGNIKPRRKINLVNVMKHTWREAIALLQAGVPHAGT